MASANAVADANAHGLRRAESLWFFDGNIVFRAEDTLFRVYKGVLIRESEFFASMLSLPQPPNRETYGECAMVTVQESALDMKLLLSALFDAK